MRILKSHFSRIDKRLLLSGVGIVTLFVILIVIKFFSPESSNPEKSVMQTAKSFNEACDDIEDFRKCYTNLFKRLANTMSIDYVLDTLTQTQKLDSRTNNCHYIAHEITYVLVKKDPQKWMDKIKQMNLSWCSVGFLHGTVLGSDLGSVDSANQVNKLDS